VFWADLNFVESRNALRSFALSKSQFCRTGMCRVWRRADDIIMVYCVVINKSRPICRSNTVKFLPPTPATLLPEKCLDSAPNYPWPFLYTVVANTAVSKNYVRVGERFTLWHCVWEVSGLRIVHPSFLDAFCIISLTVLHHSDFRQTFGYVASCSEI
jgi:hypothetical protein